MSTPTTTIRESVNAPGPGRPAILSAQAQREYVAGGAAASSALASYYEALSQYVDDAEQQFGDDIYTRMMQDPQIFSAIQILKGAVLAHDVDVQPALGDEEEGYDRALEVAQLCQRCLARLPYFRTKTLHGLLGALAYGHRLAEITWEIETLGVDAGKLVPRAIKVKPRRNYALIVDPYRNIVGVAAVIPGQTYSPLSVAGSANPAKQENVLPRSKFMVLSILDQDGSPQDGSPQGASWLRPVYNCWWLKQQVWPEYLKYLMQFAAPSIIGKTAEGAQQTPILDTDGNPVLDTDGNVTYNNPQDQLLSALLQYRNSTALALPFGTEVETLFNYTTGEAFRFAVDIYNDEINQGVLFQKLATSEAKFGSRSAAQVHQDILQLPIQYLRTVVEECIERDLFARIVEYNYGPDWLQWTPKAQLGDVEEQDFAAHATAIAALYKAGYFDTSQLRPLDVRLGVPLRDPADVEARREAEEAGREMARAGAEAAAGGNQAEGGEVESEGETGDEPAAGDE